jgi:hypothetical protein
MQREILLVSARRSDVGFMEMGVETWREGEKERNGEKERERERKGERGGRVSKIVCVGACIDRILQFMRPHNGVALR